MSRFASFINKNEIFCIELITYFVFLEWIDGSSFGCEKCLLFQEWNTNIVAFSLIFLRHYKFLVLNRIRYQRNECAHKNSVTHENWNGKQETRSSMYFLCPAKIQERQYVLWCESTPTTRMTYANVVFLFFFCLAALYNITDIVFTVV